MVLTSTVRNGSDWEGIEMWTDEDMQEFDYFERLGAGHAVDEASTIQDEIEKAALREEEETDWTAVAYDATGVWS